MRPMLRAVDRIERVRLSWPGFLRLDAAPLTRCGFGCCAGQMGAVSESEMLSVNGDHLPCAVPAGPGDIAGVAASRMGGMRQAI
ncbi:hypothetical protein [Paracoccus sp. MKU1]|uniref:hypothetical protein n=1 Tax=Paracoccus sp. MKU1 TaxID=1745182 RepID=UPI00128FCA36|nr:hypothetical protein [Paracoccus sp. MKU1]